MEYNPQPLLSRLPKTDMPQDLSNRILTSIQTARTKRIRSRFALAIMGLVVSLGYAAANVAFIWTEIRTSSFLSLVRLVGSDPDIVFIHAKDLFLGLLETLPLASILVVLTGAFFLVIAAVMANAFLQNRHHHSNNYLIPLQ